MASAAAVGAGGGTAVVEGRPLERLWFWAVGSDDWRPVAGPMVFVFVALGLLVYDHVQGRVSDALFWLGLALIIAVFFRMLETIRRSSQTIEQQRERAQLDPITGLGNRSRLGADLKTALAEPKRQRSFVLLELDGLQAYTNRFGQEDSDELLQRVAERLNSCVAPMEGEAYRIDGNQLAVLVPGDDQQMSELVAASVASLDEHDGSLLVRSCYGEVALPRDADSPERVLQVASQRLTARKQRQLGSARRQAHSVLTAVLAARRPELRDHLRAVAPRVIAIGRRLGLDGENLDDVVLAASLQDIGMLTVPEEVLEKQGQLSDAERALIHQHPLAGQRIIAAAPALARVAELVRSSYERFDGSGYPDGLAGQDIPLGARIISVAVAMAAMTSQRPYRPAKTVEEALEELRLCAGSQFDPKVVEALAEDLTEEASSPPPSAPPPSAVAAD